MTYATTGLNKLSDQIALWREGKGFHTPDSLEHSEAVLGKLMLVVTEVAEAAEAIRDKDDANFVEELADIIIRVLDLCGTMKIDIETAIRVKMDINKRRPERHGRQSSL